MKKTLIILVLLGLIWLLFLPGLVGLFLDRKVPSWLEARGWDEAARFESGWFASRLRIADDYRLNLDARHLPPLGLSWLRLAGSVESGIGPSPINVEGRFGLTGHNTLQLRTGRLALDGPIRLDTGEARLALEQARDQSGLMRWQVEAAKLNDQLGNVLSGNEFGLSLAWAATPRHSADSAGRHESQPKLDLQLSLHLDSISGPTVDLKIDALSVQRAALVDLIEGLQQLSRSAEGTTARQLALLTVAGAWQQLSGDGLRIQLSTFQLGPATSFRAHWPGDEGSPLISGNGSIAASINTLSPIVGLTAGVDPATADRLIQAWLGQLEQQGWLRVENDQFEFRYPAAEEQV